MEKPIIKVAVNVFVIKDNKILLGKRKHVKSDGFWGLPGGHLESMESLIGGAKRELEEETGLTANLIFESIVNDPLSEDNTHYVHINFLADEVEGEPRIMEPNKCYEWRWFLLSELPLNLFLGHRDTIKTFLNKEGFADFINGVRQ